MIKELENKVVIVTGASKGIGAGIAKQMGASGAKVVVNYATSKEGAELVVSEIEQSGGIAISVQGDMSKQEDVKRLFAETLKIFGEVNVLVNNAGIYEFGLLEHATEDLYITRKTANNDLLFRFDDIVSNYFKDNSKHGLPTVNVIAQELNVSQSYLSDMLRTVTGQNAQQHIHNRLIEEAKTILTSTNKSVSEIAFLLGFEYPQSFNKLFKKKMDLSPLEFRQSFSLNKN